MNIQGAEDKTGELFFFFSSNIIVTFTLSFIYILITHSTLQSYYPIGTKLIIFEVSTWMSLSVLIWIQFVKTDPCVTEVLNKC